MKKISISIIVVFLFVGMLTGCDSLYYSEYTLTGKVENQSNEEGIEGVKILFNGKDAVYTNSNGEWGKTGLTGRVIVSVEKDGWDFDNSTYEINGSEEIITKAAKQEITENYSVSGKITDKNDKALEGVVVRFNGGYSSVTTDENGDWIREGVNGEIIVTPEYEGWEFNPESRTVSNEENNLDFKGQNMDYSVSGKITDQDDNPISDVEIQFSDGTEKVKTGAEGKWSKSGLGGLVTITPVHEDYVFTPSTREVYDDESDVDFDGVLQEETYRISGNIVDQSDNPLQGVVVRFNGGYSSVTTDENGDWIREGVNGEITVTPEKNGWEFVPESRTVSNEESNLNFTGQNIDYSVSGKVTDKPDGAGDPIANVTINFSDGSSSVTTGTDGSWSKSRLGGLVTITPEKEGYIFTPSSKDVIGERDDVGFTGTLEEETYRISGTVVNKESDELLSGVTLSFGDITTTETDSNGYWEVSNLVGEVKITAELEGWQFAPSKSDDTYVSIEDDGRDDIVFEGVRENDFAYYEVSGQIINTDGVGIDGVLIEFIKDENIIGTAITKDGGNWTEENLWGNVEVRPDPDSKSWISEFTPSSLPVDRESSTVDFIAK